MAPRVWHISGANTGFGLELALKALKEGDQVIAAVRSPSKIPDNLKVDGVKVLQYDLSFSQEDMNSYAEKAFAAFGRVDVLVNNAGYAYMGAIEETEYIPLFLPLSNPPTTNTPSPSQRRHGQNPI
jgi:NAD(P)-dependent dehydrogenase (short-subunit alcohol dehydrogenase family)